MVLFSGGTLLPTQVSKQIVLEMTIHRALTGNALLLLLAAAAAFAEVAVECDPTQCALPTCRCSSTETPGGFEYRRTPHFVVLSFDEAVTYTNHPFYQELQTRKNPNNCGIKMTFFVSHENTDYTLVNDLYRNGHEIAVHSVTHKSDVENYWRNLTKEGWMAEIVQQKKMLEIYGKIPASEIQGFRAPFLEVGGNEMYGALHEAGFDYDSSWPSLQYTSWLTQPDGSTLGALWPYTLDYKSVQDQTVGTKPTDAFPGLWVTPIMDLQDFSGVECSTLDACHSITDELDTSSTAVANLLMKNFRSLYYSRTPFLVNLRYSWFYNEARKEGLKKFLDDLRMYNEAYVVSVRQMLDWVKNPVSLADLGKQESLQCGNTLVNNDCKKIDYKNCRYTAPLPISNYEVYMNICQGPCPENYPYLNNVNGSKSYPLDGQ